MSISLSSVLIIFIVIIALLFPFFFVNALALGHDDNGQEAIINSSSQSSSTLTSLPVDNNSNNVVTLPTTMGASNNETTGSIVPSSSNPDNGTTTSTTNNKFLRVIMRPQIDQQTLINLYTAFVQKGDITDMHTNINNLAYAKQLFQSTGASYMGGSFFSISAIKAYAPQIKAAGGNEIGYDLENSYSPAAELADPITSMQQASSIAHQNGLLFMADASRKLTSDFYDAFAKVSDIYNIQSEGLTDNPSAFSSFIHDIIPKIKAAHPGIPVIVETSTARGTVSQMEQDFASVADVADGSGSWFGNNSEGLDTLESYLIWFVQNYKDKSIANSATTPNTTTPNTTTPNTTAPNTTTPLTTNTAVATDNTTPSQPTTPLSSSKIFNPTTNTTTHSQITAANSISALGKYSPVVNLTSQRPVINNISELSQQTKQQQPLYSTVTTSLPSSSAPLSVQQQTIQSLALPPLSQLQQQLQRPLFNSNPLQQPNNNPYPYNLYRVYPYTPYQLSSQQQIAQQPLLQQSQRPLPTNNNNANPPHLPYLYSYQNKQQPLVNGGELVRLGSAGSYSAFNAGSTNGGITASSIVNVLVKKNNNNINQSSLQQSQVQQLHQQQLSPYTTSSQLLSQSRALLQQQTSMPFIQHRNSPFSNPGY